MSDVDGRRWAIVVFGPIALLLGLVAVVYGGLFLVPGAPCEGANSVTPPASDFAVAENDSAISVVHVGNGTLGGPTTDRVVVTVRNFESPDATSKKWIGDGETLERGDTLAIPKDEIGFDISGRDRVSVEWYGKDPDVAGFCPNGRTYSELRIVRLENASMVIETGTK